MKKKDSKRINKNNSIIKSLKEVVWVREKDIELTCAMCPVQLEFKDINGMNYYYRSRHDMYALHKSKSWDTMFDNLYIAIGFDDGIITESAEIFEMIKNDSGPDIRILKGGK